MDNLTTSNGRKVWLWWVLGGVGCLAILCCIALAVALVIFGGATEVASVLQPATPTRQPTSTQVPTRTPRPSITPSAVPPTLTVTDIDTTTFIPEETELTAGVGKNSSERPRLGSDVLTVENYRFRVLYTLEGKNAIDDIDENGNGLPDYAENVILALEYSAQLLKLWGWDLPPDDGKKGGDSRYDVYITELDEDDESAHVSPERNVGDNPNSADEESNAYTSHMVVDNNLMDIDPDAGYDGIGYLRSTVAHEWLHALQMGYDGDEPADWLWEASSSWVQDEVYPDVNDGNDYLSAVFSSPDTCLWSEGGTEREEDDTHWYGEWIFLRYLSEKYGHDIVREFWVAARTEDGNAVLEQVLAQHGSTLLAERQGFAVALLLRAFREGENYPTVRLQDEIGLGKTSPADGVAQLGIDYFAVQANGAVQATFSESNLQGWWVGVSGDTALIYASDEPFTPDGYDYAYLVVHNNDMVEKGDDCSFEPYTLTLTTASGDGIPQAVRELVVGFQTPEVATVTTVGSTEGEQAATEYDDAPADLVPATLPEDYEVAGSYILTHADLEEDNIIWYLPQAEKGSVVDILGPDDDQYITITASTHRYSDFADWLSDVDYDPPTNETFYIAGTQVLIEDFSESSDAPFYSATFLRGKQFIVIDASVSLAEMKQMVLELLSQAP